MPGILKYFRDRWNDWVGDADMERAIRKHLSINGYFGATAKLRNVRLVAVQRPGWLQVYRFEAAARVQPPDLDEDAPEPDAEYRELFGLVRDDARKNLSSVRVFVGETERRQLFAEWTEDLICLRGAQGLVEPKA